MAACHRPRASTSPSHPVRNVASMPGDAPEAQDRDVGYPAEEDLLAGSPPPSGLR